MLSQTTGPSNLVLSTLTGGSPPGPQPRNVPSPTGFDWRGCRMNWFLLQKKMYVLILSYELDFDVECDLVTGMGGLNHNFQFKNCLGPITSSV